MNKVRLAWFSPHPIHYNNFLFEQLSKSIPVQLDLFFFKKVLANYPWKKGLFISNPIYIFKKYLGVDWRVIFQFVISQRSSYDAVVVAGWSEPTMIVLLSYFRLSGKSYIIYTDTPNEIRGKNLKQWLRKIWLSWILSKSKAVLVTGEKGLKTLEMWGAKKESVYNFPFATDLDFFSPNPNFLNFSVHPIKIFASGRLDIRHKGYNTALQALAFLKERRPDIKFIYSIAGSGPDEGLIRKQVSLYQLDEYVVFLGWLETGALLEQYQNADVLLHTAINDPFPNAVLEAMACGLIVVGSDSSGSVLERVIDKVNGLIHRTQDAESVYSCLLYLADRGEKERQNLKTNARSTAKKWSVEYNIEVMRKILQVE